MVGDLEVDCPKCGYEFILVCGPVLSQRWDDRSEITVQCRNCDEIFLIKPLKCKRFDDSVKELCENLRKDLS